MRHIKPDSSSVQEDPPQRTDQPAIYEDVKTRGAKPRHLVGIVRNRTGDFLLQKRTNDSSKYS